MEIRKISIYRLNIPFFLPISHNLADRSKTDSIIVVIEDSEGLRGYGEGSPRTYVTGETPESAVHAAEAFSTDIVGRKFGSTGIVEFLKEKGDAGSALRNPSAWCALELALLDLHAKRKNVPIWRLFDEKPCRDEFVYSAVLPIVSRQTMDGFLELISSRQMKFVKVKISRNNGHLSCLQRMRKVLGPGIDMRVDANAAFSAEQALEFLKRAAPAGLSAFEQPVPKDDMAGLRVVTRLGGVMVIADESICSHDDARNLIENRACNGFNIRISKCGGFLKSLSILRRARKAGISCQLGCHIGETGILAAAGRHFAALCPDLLFLEGSFSKYLLKEDIIHEDISFGEKGHAPLLQAPGLGVEIDETRLNRWGKKAALVE